MFSEEIANETRRGRNACAFQAVPYAAAAASGSKEERMSTIALTDKAAKLMRLCGAEGFESLDDLPQAAAFDSVCPAKRLAASRA